MRYISLCVIILAMFINVVPASAETFVLKDGKEIDGTILRTTDSKVTLTTKIGVSTYNVMEFDEKTRKKYFANLKPVAVPKQMKSSTPSKKKSTLITDSIDLKESIPKAVLGLMIAGGVLCVIGSLWFIVAGFAESVGWGIALILFNGIAGLAFLILHWDRAKAPVITYLLGVALFIATVIIGK